MSWMMIYFLSKATIISLVKKIPNILFAIDDKVAAEVDNADNSNGNTTTDESSEPMDE